MKKIFLLFLLPAAIYSCKKNDSIKAQYSKLIVGSWESTGQHTRVYDLNTDELLKDSTIEYTGTNANRAWMEIYNTDGSSYVTTLSALRPGAAIATTDTTSFLSYSILGSSLVLKQNIGGSTTKPILAMDNTSMDLESTTTGTLPASWRLDVTTSYKIVQATHYTRP